MKSSPRPEDGNNVIYDNQFYAPSLTHQPEKQGFSRISLPDHMLGMPDRESMTYGLVPSTLFVAPRYDNNMVSGFPKGSNVKPKSYQVTRTTPGSVINGGAPPSVQPPEVYEYLDKHMDVAPEEDFVEVGLNKDVEVESKSL